MKMRLLALLVCSVAFTLMGADENPLLKTPRDKISYSLGMNIGQSITNQAVEVNPDAFAAGLKAIVTGAKPLLTKEEYDATMKSFNEEMRAKNDARRKEMMAKQAEKSKELGDKNKAEGEKFLAENKSKEGVKTTPSGLQYKIITPGTGKVPTRADTVVTQYRGTFIDGKEFDSSYKRGEPFTTGVTNVIKGWTEALTMMPVGSKWQLFIPAELAYGQGGRGIPPNATLLFDMELLQIKDKSSPADKPK